MAARHRAAGTLLAALLALAGGAAADASFRVGVDGAVRITSARIFPGVRSVIPVRVADLSGGDSATISSDPMAAADGRLFTSGRFASGFSTKRFLELTLPSSLAEGVAATNATFEITFATAGGGTACVYVEARRASTGALVGTLGSATSPLACRSSSSQQLTSVPVPGVAGTTLVNDLRFRVYARSTTSRSIALDRVALTGSAFGPFELTPISRVDASSGTPSAPATWALTTTDGSGLTSSSSWPSSFSPSRSLRATLPTVVPPGAVVTGATLRHTYASVSSGTTCYWVSIRTAAGAQLATRGSPSAPLSCNASTAMATDTVLLPELTNGSDANGLVVELFVRQSSSGKSRHDQLMLELTYSLP